MAKLLYLQLFLCGLSIKAQSQLDELYLKLCKSHSVDFDRGINDPFHQYLFKVYHNGETDLELYLSFAEYLFSENDEHEILNSSDQNHQTLSASLEAIGTYKNAVLNYDPLIKILRKKRSTDPFASDLYDILTQIKKHDYHVTAGLVAVGIDMAIKENHVQQGEYEIILTLILSPYALFNGL